MGRLGRREATPAVVLAIHTQLTRLARGLGIVRTKILPNRRQPVARRRRAQKLPAVIKQLVRRDGQRRGNKLKPLALRHTAGLGQAQRVTGPTTSLPVKAVRRHRALPGRAVIACHDQVHVRNIGRPGLQGREPQLVLGHGLDVGIGPANRGLKPLLAQKLHRLERAGPATGVKQQRTHQRSSQSSTPKSVSRTCVTLGWRAIRATIKMSPTQPDK